MKQVADKLAAAKDRYDNARAVAAEKRGVAREQIKSMNDVAKGKTASIREVSASLNKDDDGVRILWLLKRTRRTEASAEETKGHVRPLLRPRISP